LTTAAQSELLYRSCSGFDELDACVALEVETWGFAGGDVIPRRVFLVAQKIGGQVIGCFDPDLPDHHNPGLENADSSAKSAPNLVAFAMALPGVRDGKPYLHSHMLAVRESYRNRGIGRRLKLAQREDALKRGLTRMEWTFDPLEIKNSFLNISRLGAIIRSYTQDFYGVSSSRLQGGLPTDRLHAEWWMNTPRVQAILDGVPVPNPNIQETISVPHSISEWKNAPSDRHRALQVQTENRERFESAFSRGLAVVGFSVDTQGNGIFELGACRDLGLNEQQGF
jgi:predicted GNAT superfamily acetyltransferase